MVKLPGSVLISPALRTSPWLCARRPGSVLLSPDLCPPPQLCACPLSSVRVSPALCSSPWLCTHLHGSVLISSALCGSPQLCVGLPTACASAGLTAETHDCLSHQNSVPWVCPHWCTLCCLPIQFYVQTLGKTRSPTHTAVPHPQPQPWAAQPTPALGGMARSALRCAHRDQIQWPFQNNRLCDSNPSHENNHLL